MQRQEFEDGLQKSGRGSLLARLSYCGFVGSEQGRGFPPLFRSPVRSQFRFLIGPWVYIGFRDGPLSARFDHSRSLAACFGSLKSTPSPSGPLRPIRFPFGPLQSTWFLSGQLGFLWSARPIRFPSGSLQSTRIPSRPARPRDYRLDSDLAALRSFLSIMS